MHDKAFRAISEGRMNTISANLNTLESRASIGF